MTQPQSLGTFGRAETDEELDEFIAEHLEAEPIPFELVGYEVATTDPDTGDHLARLPLVPSVCNQPCIHHRCRCRLSGCQPTTAG